jgi:hypothetical protein
MNIPPTYLNYQLRWIREDEGRAKRLAELADTIEKFFKQT